MKRFVVTFQSVRDGTVFVEAETEDEAISEIEDGNVEEYQVDWFGETNEVYSADPAEDDHSDHDNTASIEP